MAKRKSTGTRLRFSVFHRDGFTCQYCGCKPPEVVLQVDHIVPVSKGGNDDIENLLTACRKCNAGKTNKELSEVTPRIEKNVEEISEKYEQLKAFYDYQQKSHKLRETMLEDVEIYWGDLFDTCFTVEQRSFVKLALKDFSAEEIMECMDISTRIKYKGSNSAFRYLCGIIRNKREKKEADEADRLWEIERNNPNNPAYEVTPEQLDEALEIMMKKTKKN